MSLIQRLFSRSPGRQSVAQPLWHRIISIAREPYWYSHYGVADTTPGRFDVLIIVLALIMLRMERNPRLIAQSVSLTELFVEDMDGQLRQSGVGDLIVGKRMSSLMSVLGGRTGALRSALPIGAEALIPVLDRNVTTSRDIGLDLLAQAVMRLWTTIDATSDDDLMAARIAT